MSSELERVHRSGRNINLFWLVVTTGMMIYCLLGAFTDQPALLHSWRGAALLLLASFYLGWYISWYWHYLHKQRGIVINWPIPWKFALRRWGYVFGLICLMTALHPIMGWLFWATFGMAFSIFRLPLMILPVTLSSLGIFYTLIVTSNPPPQAIPWIAVSLGLGMLASGYLSYLPGRLLRERAEREQVFSALEDAHRQLADAHRQLELSAEREADMAVLSERSRLAREMHDTIGHALVLIAVKLEAAQRLRAVNPERADHEIEVTKEIVRSTMSEMRATLANLRSPITTQQSIGEMLARRARESAERASFHVTYQMQPDLGDIGSPVREALYRIGVEALTNIEKHAHAHAVTLSLSRREETMVLQVEDDGVGNPTLVAARQQATGALSTQPSSPPGHYGITGMRERVEALGGHLTLGPRSGGGTVVEASIPLSALTS